jgi:N-carbamoylputrescine amidase
MTALTVALLQMTSCGTDQDANLAKGERFCRQARELSADVALFPEMWSNGYTPIAPILPGGDIWRSPDRWNGDQQPRRPASPEARRDWLAQAIDRDSSFVRHFQDLARELDMAIALTYLERWDGLPRNSVSLIDRHGDTVLTYAKVHTCDFDEPEGSLTPGDGFSVCDLDTVSGPVKIGAMICFDREFPESARVLMLQGAEVILTPNACELEVNRLAQFRTRAFENMVGVAMTNYAAPEQNGHSVAYHPVAFDQTGKPRDLLVVEAGEVEGVYPARFDLDDIRAYREREVWGNAFRRPQHYGALVDEAVESPFTRVDEDGRPFHETRRHER